MQLQAASRDTDQSNYNPSHSSSCMHAVSCASTFYFQDMLASAPSAKCPSAVHIHPGKAPHVPGKLTRTQLQMHVFFLALGAVDVAD